MCIRDRCWLVLSPAAAHPAPRPALPLPPVSYTHLALERAVANGVKNLVIQPTHLMHGAEYDEMMEMVDSYRDKFESVAIAEPLLGEVGSLSLIHISIGMQWDAREAKWAGAFRRAEEYCAAHGNLLVPVNYKTCL